jgi:hypothetical protein
LITKYSIFRQAFGKNFEFSERQKCSSSDKLFGLIIYKLIRKHIHSDTLKIASPANANIESVTARHCRAILQVA